MKDLKNTKLCESTKQRSYEFTETKAASTGHAQAFTRFFMYELWFSV